MLDKAIFYSNLISKNYNYCYLAKNIEPIKFVMKKRNKLFKDYLQEYKNIWKRILGKSKLITGITKIIVGITKIIVGIFKIIKL